jgi:FkbM family methyltransferase
MRDWIEGHSKKYFTHVKELDTIVSGGACCGMHIRFYAKMFKRVIAYEPDPLSFYCMSLNAPFDNVVKLNAAMGEYPGLVDINRSDGTNIGTHTVKEGHSIPIIPIDALALDSCSLIQLDVEGMELPVLSGAANTIFKYKPVIIGESMASEANQEYMKSMYSYKLVDTSFADAIYIPE